MHPKGLGAGKHFKQLALPADVRPTILETLGVKNAAPGEGRSLKPVLKGKAKKVRDYVVFGRPLKPRWGVNPNTVTTDRWSLIHHPWAPKKDRLYDLKADLKQLKNVAKANPGVTPNSPKCLSAVHLLRWST